MPNFNLLFRSSSFFCWTVRITLFNVADIRFQCERFGPTHVFRFNRKDWGHIAKQSDLYPILKCSLSVVASLIFRRCKRHTRRLKEEWRRDQNECGSSKDCFIGCSDPACHEGVFVWCVPTNRYQPTSLNLCLVVFFSLVFYRLCSLTLKKLVVLKELDKELNSLSIAVKIQVGELSSRVWFEQRAQLQDAWEHRVAVSPVPHRLSVPCRTPLSLIM